MCKSILVFAGTYEGHKLAKYFSAKGYKGDFCVATEYGNETLGDVTGINVHAGRLNRSQICNMITGNRYSLVIDATHPYAREVTENIKAAAADCQVNYLRLLREETRSDLENVVSVNNIDEAVEVLNNLDGNILLTTGAKELAKYLDIHDFTKRVYARVLPSHMSLDLALDTGMPSQNIICMQGPFSAELNIAMLNQFGCKTLVTKNTGRPGGFDDKIKCAQMGYNVVVIGTMQSIKRMLRCK